MMINEILEVLEHIEHARSFVCSDTRKYGFNKYVDSLDLIERDKKTVKESFESCCKNLNEASEELRNIITVLPKR
jgi:hypothetical protein